MKNDTNGSLSNSGGVS